MGKRLAAPSFSPDKKQRREEPIRVMQNALQSSIKLTSAEKRLFAFLLEVAAQPAANGAVLRVAGGWVRDKLLGRNSDDIDIVLDRMTGRAFADLVNAYEAAQGHTTRAVGVIKANPEQSKHLETATMQIREDMSWVDFVNLRAETYASEDNRIPTVEIGTPQQDAERRDFTINSLFYNLATKQVEDFTKRGIEDLENGRLRTPLEPRITFLDDPLRVLRAVRFASRFNCTLEDDLRAAAQLEEVRAALVRKVSRERVGKELCGMLTGSSAHPERALRLLHELQLCESVFLPSVLLDKTPVCHVNGELVQVDENVWDRGFAYGLEMYRLISTDKDLNIDSFSAEKKHELQIRILAAFLLPFRGLCVRDKRLRSVAMFVVQDALKMSTREAKDVDNILLFVDEFQKVTTEAFDRVKVGLLIRNIGAQWEICRDAACAKEIADAGLGNEAVEARKLVAQRYDTLSLRVVDAGLDKVWEFKPLLNGNDLVKQFGIKPGPLIKELLGHIMAWQLGNPEGKRDECMVYVKTIADAVSK